MQQIYIMYLNTFHREHYQWNMDIWGIDNVEAEAELLSAICFALSKIGLDHNDVGIKVLNALFIHYHIH